MTSVRCLLVLPALLAGPVTTGSRLAAEAPRPLAPAAGALTHVPQPHFRWQREADVRIEETHRLQIAKDESFREIVCDDTLAVVSRFVPVKPLAPAAYWWRVRRGEGDWSAAVPFEVREPERAITVRAGSDASAVARAMLDAAARGPARVDFEPGEYRLSVTRRDGLATLTGACDLLIDGHGARLVLEGETCLLSLRDCRRMTLRDLRVTGARPGHTLVRVLSVDASKKALLVRPEPGYDADLPRFFGGQGFLNRVDPAHPGRHLGGFVSTQEATATPAPGATGDFVVAPAPADALRRHEAGGLAVVTRYDVPFVMMKRSEECTFDRVTLVDLPGAFCGGDETPAKSYLACRVECRSPGDFQGGHSAVGDGRIGEWVEGCEFNRLADDGPNVRTMRMKVADAVGDDAVRLEDSWTNTDLRPGDTVALVNPADFRTATAPVTAVSPGRRALRVTIGVSLQAVAERIGVTAWPGAFLYRVDPACEDFVYRRNRHLGGRGHGVKYNGKRGWIADNVFVNITGNAIEAGYSWNQGFEGYGASDVVISGNTIRLCGWAPISSHSPTALGGRLVIRDNRIEEVRDAAVVLRHCRDAVVTGNAFSSSTAPTRGAWVVAEEAEEIRCTGNRCPDSTPEFRMTPGRT